MNILLVEDEYAAAQRLEELIKRCRPNAVVVAQPDSVEETVAWLQKNDAPDLILMDVQLADGLCFSIFDQVDVQAPIIFTTAYDQFAMDAFKVNSVDYLLKPIKEVELSSALSKMEQFHTQPLVPDLAGLAATIGQQEPAYKKRFLIRVGQAIKLVQVQDIAYFYAAQKNTFLCTFEDRTYTVDESLDKLAAVLSPQLFFRVNRQFIVNLDAIEAMHTYSKSRVLLTLTPSYKEKVIVSTDRSPHFKKWLADEPE